MIRKKKDTDWSEAGKKSWETRRERARHTKRQDSGKKAWTDSIRPSEKNYIDVLSKKFGVSKKRIFHHEGVPDIFVITEEGKLKFYEIKPSKGGVKRTLLNPTQTKTIRELLKNDLVEEVNIVRYSGKGKDIVYDKPIKLTLSTLKKHSMPR